MGTIKILGFDENGNAQRLKIRIARFLDYDPVTDSDKSNIRSTLGITSQGGLGDLLAANNLDDVASLDTTKANLEIPDVGTSPQEVPNNSMLGSLAYQSADSVSAGAVEADELDIVPASGDARIDLISGDNTSSSRVVFGDSDDANVGEVRYSHNNNSLAFHTGNTGEKLRIDSQGRVGIGLTNPGDYNGVTQDLVVGATTSSHGISIVAGTGAASAISFADSDDSLAGRIQYDHGANSLKFRVNGGEKWYIASDGNLVCNVAGKGINFGVVPTSGTSPSSSTLSDYEEGTWTVTTDGDATGVIGSQYASYTKVGRLVTVRAVFTVTSNFSSNGIGGLPFDIEAPSGSSSSVSTGGIVLTSNAADSPIVCHGNHAQSYVKFRVGSNVNAVHNLNTTNSIYRLQFSYETA